jgi:hypothetical protein
MKDLIDNTTGYKLDLYKLLYCAITNAKSIERNESKDDFSITTADFDTVRVSLDISLSSSSNVSLSIHINDMPYSTNLYDKDLDLKTIFGYINNKMHSLSDRQYEIKRNDSLRIAQELIDSYC